LSHANRGWTFQQWNNLASYLAARYE
jgi:hypothetical protein